MSCYFCGKDDHYVCDFALPVADWKKRRDGTWEHTCARHVCADHAVPEYKDQVDIKRAAYHLCKEHAEFQQ